MGTLICFSILSSYILCMGAPSGNVTNNQSLLPCQWARRDQLDRLKVIDLK